MLMSPSHPLLPPSPPAYNLYTLWQPRGVRRGGRLKREVTYVYLASLHVDIWQKPSQYWTLYGTTNWFKIEKVVRQGCLLSPCLFNLNAELIMRNDGLDELQPGIKMGGRNINNLSNVDDTTLMAENEEELKSLLMRVKEESERVGLKLNIKKN